VKRIVDEALAPFSREGGESPYEIHHDLQETMQSLVGIIRTESELVEAIAELDKLDDRAANLSVSGGRAYNPGWNLATDIPPMLAVSRMVTMGAINRKESRGGHTRDDYPGPVPEMGKVNFVQRLDDTGKVTVTAEERPEMPPELQELLEDGH
jgi:succinate dehydrogenase / fumarate reductase flavoprotein subunit